jgi:multiple sugar transport system permease protein
MNEHAARKILLSIGAAATLIFCLGPFVYMLATALATHPEFLGPGRQFIPTLTHFGTVLFSETAHFMRYLTNSIIISGLSALTSVFIAALGAYALTRLSIPAGRSIMLVVLGISMFPPISLISYLFKLMSALGWMNTYPALILPYVAWTLPLSLWILVSYFAQIPQELDRAGLVDGCSRVKILVRIILPVAAPGVFATFLLAFIYAFNEFLIALMLTTDRAARTIPVGIALFEGIHGQVAWGEIMAAATVTTLPVVVLVLIFQRRIIQGLTRGAVKT